MIDKLPYAFIEKYNPQGRAIIQPVLTFVDGIEIVTVLHGGYISEANEPGSKPYFLIKCNNSAVMTIVTDLERWGAVAIDLHTFDRRIASTPVKLSLVDLEFIKSQLPKLLHGVM